VLAGPEHHRGGRRPDSRAGAVQLCQRGRVLEIARALNTKTDHRDKDRIDKAALMRLKQELGKG